MKARGIDCVGVVILLHIEKMQDPAFIIQNTNRATGTDTHVNPTYCGAPQCAKCKMQQIQRRKLDRLQC